MAKIRERLYARCPFGKAPSYLKDYLDDGARHQTGEPGVLHLELPLAVFGLPGGLSVSGDVVARFTPIADAVHGMHRTVVNCEPQRGGAFPRFTGDVTVDADDERGACTLTIEGDYEPLVGPVGKAFDAAIGRRIAEATAREVLRELRRSIEDGYALEQHAGRA